MRGAREYCSLFKNAEQIGRLYILPSHHARGRTFRVFVLPENEPVIENGGVNPPLNADAVEVYGIVSGNPGWTEEYGWLHTGRWQDDFAEICRSRIEQLHEGAAQNAARDTEARAKKEGRIYALLSTYWPMSTPGSSTQRRSYRPAR